MKTLKGYKVVSVRGKERWSWIFFPDVRRPSGAVRYQRGRWTRALNSCGPLAVFGSKAAARRFSRLDCTEVWECEYQTSDRTQLHNREGWRDEFPTGTILAEAVKLTRRVA